MAGIDTEIGAPNRGHGNRNGVAGLPVSGAARGPGSAARDAERATREDEAERVQPDKARTVNSRFPAMAQGKKSELRDTNMLSNTLIDQVSEANGSALQMGHMW